MSYNVFSCKLMLEGNLTKLDGIVFVGQRGNLFLIIYSLLSVWWLIIIRFNGRSKIRSPNFLNIEFRISPEITNWKPMTSELMRGLSGPAT